MKFTGVGIWKSGRGAMVHIPLLLIHPPTSVSIYSTDILGDSAVCLCAWMVLWKMQKIMWFIYLFQEPLGNHDAQPLKNAQTQYKILRLQVKAFIFTVILGANI